VLLLRALVGALVEVDGADGVRDRDAVAEEIVVKARAHLADERVAPPEVVDEEAAPVLDARVAEGREQAFGRRLRQDAGTAAHHPKRHLLDAGRRDLVADRDADAPAHDRGRLREVDDRVLRDV
jgi:hypothetical protein